MRRNRLVLWTGLLGMSLLWAACSPVIPNTGANLGQIGRSVANVEELESLLQALGAQVDRVGTQPKPYFNQDAVLLKVDGEVVEVFEFPDAAGADQAARSISLDGHRVGDLQLDTTGTPYFFKDQRLIVLYLGEDHATLIKLATILGMPITHPRQPLNYPSLDEQNA